MPGRCPSRGSDIDSAAVLSAPAQGRGTFDNASNISPRPVQGVACGRPPCHRRRCKRKPRLPFPGAYPHAPPPVAGANAARSAARASSTWSATAGKEVTGAPTRRFASKRVVRQPKPSLHRPGRASPSQEIRHPRGVSPSRGERPRARTSVPSRCRRQYDGSAVANLTPRLSPKPAARGGLHKHMRFCPALRPLEARTFAHDAARPGP